MKDTTQIKPIKFTIENKDGVYIRTPEQEVNQNITLVRIKTISNIEQIIDIEKIVKEFTICGIEIFLLDYLNLGGLPITIKDIFINADIKNTSEIETKLIENSKIEVTLFPREKLHFLL